MFVKMRWFFPLLVAVVACSTWKALPAFSQEEGQEEKAEILVRNYRSETITMDFSYVFRDYSWQMMEQDIGIDGDITYKFPTGLPGCEYLMDWGIDTGRLTITNARGVICTHNVSICERRSMTVDVRAQTCRMRRN